MRVCALQVSSGLMLLQRRTDTLVPWARISLTCQIGGSVPLAASPASHRKYFLSICELGARFGEGREVGEGATSALMERGEVLIIIFGEIGKIVGTAL